MEPLQQLKDRLDTNLSDYHSRIKGFSKEEIIQRAGEISAATDAHFHLQNHHDFSPDETAYLLRFENPLEVVADAWRRRTSDLSDMSFALYEVFDQQGTHVPYAFVKDAEAAQPFTKEKASVRKQLEDAAKKTTGHPKVEMPSKSAKKQSGRDSSL